MPSWSQLLREADSHASAQNPNGGIFYLLERKKDFIKSLSEHTGRNTILYFSSFLHKAGQDTSINDKDVNAFMETVHKMDKKKGLDLILHTPGGDVSSTEQIIKYLHLIFNGDVRAIVPQMAMSAGSMIAVSCKSIVMGKQSCLGPFDPHLNNIPCQSVIKEFDRAISDVERHPASLGLWQTIISKLTPTFITLCGQADQLAQELTNNILSESDYSQEVKENILRVFCDNGDSKVHSRHINISRCKDVGLHVEDLEADQVMQDIVLSIHHCCMILGEKSNVVKMVENNIGGCYVIHAAPAPAQNIIVPPVPHIQMPFDASDRKPF